MEVKFYKYDSVTYSLTILGTVDNFTSFNFTRSFAGIGNWQMTISGLTENAQRVKCANMISAGNGVAGLITDFQEEVSNDGITYTFSGLELKALAGTRIIIPPSGSAYQSYSKQSPEYIMSDLIKTQLIQSSNSRRYNGSIESYAVKSTERISFDGRFDALDETLSNIAETYAIGWYADIQDDNRIVWHITHGLDRTEGQSVNNRFILSYEWDTLETTNLQHTETIPTTALVAGQGEGTERSTVLVGDDAFGLSRREIYIDARDIEDATNLPQRGQEKLAEYGGDTVFDITLPPNMITLYREDFDLGDIGTVRTDAITANLILSEVTEVYEGGALIRIDTLFGFDKQTITSAMKRINSNADTLVKVEGSQGGQSGTTNYTELENKPSINGYTLTGNKTAANLGLANSSHTHDDRYYTESEMNTKLNAKSDTGHTHDDRYYTESEIDEQLSSKSDTGHTHDDRYYTESEINTKLNAKSNTGHTHTTSDVSGLASVAVSGSYNDLTNKPTIPSAYTLPTATTSRLGGVKVDGSSITVTSGGVISAVAGGGVGSTYFATCATAQATQAKVLTFPSGCPSFTFADISDDTGIGTVLYVQFTYSNSASNPYFTVNGENTGYVARYGTTGPLTYWWYPNAVMCFIWNGTYWMLNDGGNATTTYYGRTKLSSTISNNSSTALTPSAVNNLGIASGTWTPTVNGVTATTKKGYYSKIGKVVTVSFYIEGKTSGAGTGSAGYVYITGLPFTPDSSTRWYSGGGQAAGLYCGANKTFIGYSLDTGSSNRIYAKAGTTTTSAGYRTSDYCSSGTSTTQAVYMGGTLTYATT